MPLPPAPPKSIVLICLSISNGCYSRQNPDHSSLCNHGKSKPCRIDRLLTAKSHTCAQKTPCYIPKVLILTLWQKCSQWLLANDQASSSTYSSLASPHLALMSRNAHDDKNGRFGERAARLTILAKLAILAIFCQFRQISSSIGIDTTWVNIGDFGDFDKFGNFGDVLPISSN